MWAWILYLFCGAAFGDPLDNEGLKSLIARYNAVAQMPLPNLTDAQRAQLLKGEVLKHMELRADGNWWVAGMLICSTSKEALWLATQDPHFTSQDDAIEANVALAPHRATWYALLDLPRPFSDRHWVIDVWDNVALAESSNNVFWEHPWKLRSNGVALVRPKVVRGEVTGLSLDVFDSAIYTPFNEGAWVFLDLPDGRSMIVYHLVTVVGGNIPDRLVATFVRQSMEKQLRTLDERARNVVPQHYRQGHAPVLGVNDAPVPFFP